MQVPYRKRETVEDSNLGAFNIKAIAHWASDSPQDTDELQMPGWSRAAHPPTSHEAGTSFVVAEEARGWPMLSLYRRETNESLPIIWHSEWGWEIPGSFAKDGDSPTLPLAVIWPGFLINTLFYAALWLGLIFGLGAARRGLRRKRGRCPQCAYDLRGGLETGCPECGWNRGEGEE